MCSPRLGGRACACAGSCWRRWWRSTRCEWIKIDFNLDPKAGCSCTDHGHGRGRMRLYAHYRGLYALYDEFRAAHPEVIVEACASGGLRVDAGLLRHVHCAFLSDPDWTPHHLATVHGNSYLLPPAAMLHWPMSEWRTGNRNQTLSLRDPALTEAQFDTILRAAFMHRFGLSWRLPDLPEKWRARLRAHLSLYAGEVVPFVRNGDLYRLTAAPSRSGNGELRPAFQIALGDRHLLLGFAPRSGAAVWDCAGWRGGRRAARARSGAQLSAARADAGADRRRPLRERGGVDGGGRGRFVRLVLHRHPRAALTTAYRRGKPPASPACLWPTGSSGACGPRCRSSPTKP